MIHNLQQSPQCIMRNNNNGCITVCKHIEQQYNDPLSQLNSDIIDYFGTFLTKQESIEFGYLNKQLYIETQKQSYLLKREIDSCFVITDDKLEKMVKERDDGFNYSFGKYLRLSLKKRFDINHF